MRAHIIFLSTSFSISLAYIYFPFIALVVAIDIFAKMKSLEKYSVIKLKFFHLKTFTPLQIM